MSYYPDLLLTFRLDKILGEKDKEMRLNSIKMKELKRLQRHRALKPVAGEFFKT